MPLKIITAPSFCELEDNLLTEIFKIKSLNILDRILIVVPQTILRNYLSYKLTYKESKNRAILNINILSIPVFIEEISSEFIEPEYTIAKESIFYEILTRDVLKENKNLALAQRLKNISNGHFYLYLTFRDLENSGFSTDYVSLLFDELSHNSNEKDSRSQVTELLYLYSKYLERIERSKILRPSDLATIIARAENSTFLKLYQNIHFYGFYDFTGIQKDLINGISQFANVTLYIPHEKNNPTYEYTNNLLGSFNSKESLFYKPKSKPNDSPKISFISAPTLGSEILFITKEISNLKQKESKENIYLPFKIAVLSRNIDNSLAIIEKIFGENKIPWFSAREMECESVQASILIRALVTLFKNDFRRTDLEFLLALKIFWPTLKNKHLYKFIFRKAGIVSCEDWHLLGKYNEEGVKEIYDKICKLINFYRDSSSLTNFDDFGEWFLSIIDEATDKLYDDINCRDKEIIDEIRDFLTNLSIFDYSEIKADLESFFTLLLSKLKSITIKVGSAGRGIFVSDLLSARGMNFDHVFIFGLNNGIFPRTIKEDPFLLDQDRKLLRQSLRNDMGFDIPSKEEGYAEENLLFLLSLLSARKSIYLTYHREDENKKPVTPSIFFNELYKILSLNNIDLFPIPKHLEHQMNAFIERYSLSSLSPNDLITYFALNNSLAEIVSLQSDTNPINLTQYYGGTIDHGLKTLKLLSKSKQNILSDYDGYVAGVHRTKFWVSDLNTISKCPYQFYLKKHISLNARKCNEIWSLDPTDEGILVHETLCELFREQIVDNKIDEVDIDKILKRLKDIFNEKFSLFIDRNPCKISIYADYTKERILKYLIPVLCEDLKILVKNNLECIYVEGCDWPSFLPNQYLLINDEVVRFRVDRIDISKNDGRLRYVDYKIGKNRFSLSSYKIPSAGINLQIPIYILSALQSDKNRSDIDSVYLFLQDKAPYEKISSEDFYSYKEDIIKFIECLLNMAKDGKFIFNENFREWCSYCDYKYACTRSSMGARERIQNLYDPDIKYFHGKGKDFNENE